MDNTFQIPVTIKNKEVSFNATMIAAGYVIKIEVEVFGKMIVFEPDEEGNYRAVINGNLQSNNAGIDPEIIREIGLTL